MKVKRGQIWVDKKNGNYLYIESKHHDIVWNAVLVKSKITHKVTERILKKYYTLLDEKAISFTSEETSMESV